MGPLEEAGKAVVDLRRARVYSLEEEEWTFEPEKLQLSVEDRCPGPEGHHLACLEAKGIVSEG